MHGILLKERKQRKNEALKSKGKEENRNYKAGCQKKFYARTTREQK